MHYMLWKPYTQSTLNPHAPIQSIQSTWPRQTNSADSSAKRGRRRRVYLFCSRCCLLLSASHNLPPHTNTNIIRIACSTRARARANQMLSSRMRKFLDGTTATTTTTNALFSGVRFLAERSLECGAIYCQLRKVERA